MKIFLDTANLQEIKEAVALGLIDGVTTNPSLIAREGRRFLEVLAEICALVDGPISAEVVATTAVGMLEESKPLTAVSPNVVIKVPMTAEGLKAVRLFSEQGVKTNVTLIFSALQAMLAAKAGAAYVSPFIGRLDDISQVGMELVEDILDIWDHYDFSTEVLVASVRNPVHVLDAARLGAHVVTLPHAVLLQLLKHPLTELGIEKFLKDWNRVPV